MSWWIVGSEGKRFVWTMNSVGRQSGPVSNWDCRDPPSGAEGKVGS